MWLCGYSARKNGDTCREKKTDCLYAVVKWDMKPQIMKDKSDIYFKMLCEQFFVNKISTLI